MKPCPACKGSGVFSVGRSRFAIPVDCPACYGDGLIPDDWRDHAERDDGACLTCGVHGTCPECVETVLQEEAAASLERPAA